MPRPERTKHDILCFCPRKPLLAVYGIDPDGDRYIHLMVKRHSRIQAEIFVGEGSSKTLIRCRECGRLHRIAFPPRGAPMLDGEDGND